MVFGKGNKFGVWSFLSEWKQEGRTFRKCEAEQVERWARQCKEMAKGWARSLSSARLRCRPHPPGTIALRTGPDLKVAAGGLPNSRTGSCFRPNIDQPTALLSSRRRSLSLVPLAFRADCVTPEVGLPNHARNPPWGLCAPVPLTWGAFVPPYLAGMDRIHCAAD